MKHSYLLYAIIGVMLMASCSTARKAMRDAAKETTPAWNAGDCVIQRSNLSLKYGNHSVSLGGWLRMKRDDVIQMNLTYGFLSIGVGTIELTQDSVLFVSRMTKQYSRSSYDELSGIVGRSISFTDIQKYFWGEATDGKTSIMSWKYAGFTDMGNSKKLPSGLEVRIKVADRSADAAIQLSNPREDDRWNQRTTINEKSYERITIEQVVRLLLSVVSKI